MKSIAVIGAGITGLTTSFLLKDKNLPVELYEASGRPGGVIQSKRQDGYLAEFGPNTLLNTNSHILSVLVHRFGDLRDRDVAPSKGRQINIDLIRLHSYHLLFQNTNL